MNKGQIVLMVLWALLALSTLAMGLFLVTPASLPWLWYGVTGCFGALNAMVIVAFGVLIHNERKKR